ncbi:MAG: response regulator [Terriglobales bacterium]
MRILVVEDEKKVAGFIRNGFEQEHYVVDVAYDGESGAELATTVDHDLIILDLMLPKMNGLEVLRKIRRTKPRVPVLILTARGTVEDRVGGLDLGADDYLIKPFAFAELAARARALLRRGDREPSEFRIADLAVDVGRRTVTRSGRDIVLSSKEFALLEFLLSHARRPLTRNIIIEHVWDMHFDSMTNVVDVYINYLRNKIDKGFSPPLIRTVRGVGYILTDQAA